MNIKFHRDNLPDINEDETGCRSAQPLREFWVSRGMVLRRLDQSSDQEQAHCLDGKRGDKRPDSPHPINDKSRGRCPWHAKGVGQARKPKSFIGVESRQFEEDTGPSHNGEDSRPLLDPLQGEAEDSSSTKVQLPREAASEDDVGEIVALVMGCFNNGVQLLDLGGYYRVVWAEVSPEPAQDVDGLLALAIGNEPSAEKQPLASLL